MHRLQVSLIALLGASVALGACVGQIGDGADDAAVTPPTSQPQSCDAGPNAGVAPMRRLTRAEYNHAVRDLLGDRSSPADDFLADEIVAGFDANAVAAVDQSVLEEYHRAAEDIAGRAVAERRDQITTCTDGDTACIHDSILALGRRAFRRPVDGELGQSLTGLYDDARVDYSHDEALALVVQAMLLSPHFLYHVELSTPEAGQWVVPLDDFEMASRLSFFLWSSIPDDALLDAAEAGTLQDDAVLEQQVRRMLDDPRAAESLASFHSQWLGLDRHGQLEDLYKDPDLYPGWTPTLAASMRAETSAFVNHVIGEGEGTFEALLTADYSFVDASLADVYGVTVSGDALEKTSLPAERAGLLTQPAVLSSLAHAAKPSWVLRGQLVREQFLCETLPPPPPDVDDTGDNDPDRLTNPDCSYCHQLMDPIGFGFDGFDAIGQARSTDEAGDPISTAGEIQQGKDRTSFDGVRDLAETLVSMEQVQRCYTQQWFQYATRRAVGDGDQCAVDALSERFVGAGDIRDLIVHITLSDGFRFRRGDDQ